MVKKYLVIKMVSVQSICPVTVLLSSVFVVFTRDYLHYFKIQDSIFLDLASCGTLEEQNETYKVLYSESKKR